jgi:signal transduction histidine kinase
MLSQAIENGPASVMIADPEGNIEYVNPKFCETTGYSKDEAIGKKANLLKSGVAPARVLSSISGPPFKPAKRGRASSATGRETATFIGNRLVSRRCAMRKGMPRHFVAITEDITALKQAAEELKRAKEAADAASRTKTAFLASMSHEIRTPMHAILGYSQLMLRDDSISPQTKENLRIVNRSGEHLLALINDVLEMSKIESGRLKLDVRSSICRACCATGGHVPPAHGGKGIDSP